MQPLFDNLKFIKNQFGPNEKKHKKIEEMEEVGKLSITALAFIRGRSFSNMLFIVDEAQNMDKETLEELRLYTNINADGEQFLQIILVGQPELRDLLQAPELAQMAQRVSVEYHIEPLSWQDTANYIRHRLVTASVEGAEDQANHIFDSVAMAVIFYLIKG